MAGTLEPAIASALAGDDALRARLELQTAAAEEIARLDGGPAPAGGRAKRLALPPSPPRPAAVVLGGGMRPIHDDLLRPLTLGGSVSLGLDFHPYAAGGKRRPHGRSPPLLPPLRAEASAASLKTQSTAVSAITFTSQSRRSRDGFPEEHATPAAAAAAANATAIARLSRELGAAKRAAETAAAAAASKADRLTAAASMARDMATQHAERLESMGRAAAESDRAAAAAGAALARTEAAASRAVGIAEARAAEAESGRAAIVGRAAAAVEAAEAEREGVVGALALIAEALSIEGGESGTEAMTLDMTPGVSDSSLGRDAWPRGVAAWSRLTFTPGGAAAALARGGRVGAKGDCAAAAVVAAARIAAGARRAAAITRRDARVARAASESVIESLGQSLARAEIHAAAMESLLARGGAPVSGPDADSGKGQSVPLPERLRAATAALGGLVARVESLEAEVAAGRAAAIAGGFLSAFGVGKWGGGDAGVTARD